MTQMQTRSWTGLFGLDKPEEAPREQGSWTKLFGVTPQNQAPTMPAAPPGVIGAGYMPPPQQASPPVGSPAAILQAQAAAMGQQQGTVGAYPPGMGPPVAPSMGSGAPATMPMQSDQYGPRGFFGNLAAGAKETIVGNLPPGVQEALPRVPFLNQPSEPGAGQFIGRAVGGIVPSTQHPESFVFGMGAQGAAERAAAPIIDHVATVAGGRVANILKNVLGGAAGAAPMGAIEEAQHNPEEWATDPATKLGKVMLAAGTAAAAGGVGGAVFGAMGKHKPAPPTDPIIPVPKPSRGGPEPMPPPEAPAEPAPWAKTQYDPEGLGPAPTPWSQTEYTPPPAPRPPAEPLPWSKSQYDPTGVGETPTPWSQTEYAPEGVAPAATPWSKTEFSPVASNPPEAPPTTPGEPAPWAKTEYDPDGLGPAPAPWSQTEYTPPVRSKADAEAPPVQATEVPRGQEAGEGRAPEGADQPGVSRVQQDGAQGGKELLEAPAPAKPPTLAEVRRQIKELGAEPIKGPKAKLVEQLEALRSKEATHETGQSGREAVADSVGQRDKPVSGDAARARKPKAQFPARVPAEAPARQPKSGEFGRVSIEKRLKEWYDSKLNADLLGETDRQPITGPQEQMFATGPKTGDWIRKEVETHPARDAVDQEIAKKFDETQTPSMFGDQPPAEPSMSAQVTPPKSVREAGPHRAMGATAAKDPFGGHMSVRDHFSAVRERIGGMVKAAGEAVRAVKDLNSNDTLPKLSRVAPKATEHLVQTVTAHDAYKPIAAHLEERVLGAKYKDEAFSRKVSGVLVEDRLRALKQKFDETADQFVDVEDNIDKIRDFLKDMDPEDPDAIEMKRDLSRLKKIKKMMDDNPDRDFEGEWRAKADAVKSIVGSTHSPFKTEAEFKAAIRDKEVAAALSRWKEQVQTSARKVHEELGGRLDAEGPNTGTFVNLKAITDEALMEHGWVEGSARGRAANARLRKSAHNREATGTAEVYELNLRDLIENTISKNLRRIELKRFYDSLVEEGQAIRAAEGTKFETPDGKPSTVPYIGETALRRIDDTKIDWDERRVESIWVKPEIEREIRNALNVEGRFKDSAIAHTTDWINKTNLKLGVDGVYHLANYLTAMSSTPIGRKWARDMGKKFPGVNIADATAKIVQARARIIADTPEVRAQLAELSKIGALPPPREGAQMMGRLIETLGNASRVAMDDMYTDLVKQGLAKDTVAGRREFVNQLGQYNGRLQHAWVRALKEVGVSPFITAGQNFNKVAIRRIGGLFGMSTGGVAPASAAAAWRLRAGQMASVIIGSFIAPPIINTMTTGSPLGRDGVPIGAIDTGQDANGKPVIVDPLKWTGLRRGLRITGVGKVAEGVRYGRNPLYVAEDAVRDIAHGFVHPFAGPVPDFAMIASTGYDTSGYKVAPAAEPGSSQYITNLITALEHTNPLIGNAVEGGKTGGFTGSLIGGLSAFSGAVGVRTAGSPPNDAARERAQYRDYKAEQRRLQRRGH